MSNLMPHLPLIYTYLRNIIDLRDIIVHSDFAIETEIMKYFKLDDQKTVGFLKKLNREMY